MKLTIDIKRKYPGFWLSGVRSARTDRSGARCLIGDRVHEVYEQTRHKSKARVEIDLPDNPRVKAYYLYGEKPYEEKLHGEGANIAFVPCKNQSVIIDNKWFRLTITDARQIDFTGYQPSQEGEFTDRPWVFANYLLDGMPL